MHTEICCRMMMHWWKGHHWSNVILRTVVTIQMVIYPTCRSLLLLVFSYAGCFWCMCSLISLSCLITYSVVCLSVLALWFYSAVMANKCTYVHPFPMEKIFVHTCSIGMKLLDPCWIHQLAWVVSGTRFGNVCTLTSTIGVEPL